MFHHKTNYVLIIVLVMDYVTLTTVNAYVITLTQEIIVLSTLNQVVQIIVEELKPEYAKKTELAAVTLDID